MARTATRKEARKPARKRARKPSGKAQPTSVRLDATTDELIRKEAKRTKRTKSAVLQSIAEEGIRMRMFPGIGFKGSEFVRSAYLLGGGGYVWLVIEAWRDFGESAERMAAEHGLSESQIRLAIAYYNRFPEEIDEAIAENKRTAEEYADRWPTFEVPPE